VIGAPTRASPESSTPANRLQRASSHPEVSREAERKPSAIKTVAVNVGFVMAMVWSMSRVQAWSGTLDLGSASSVAANGLAWVLGGLALLNAWRTLRLGFSRTEGLLVVVTETTGGTFASLKVMDATGRTRTLARSRPPPRAVGDVLFIWVRADVLLADTLIEVPPAA